MIPFLLQGRKRAIQDRTQLIERRRLLNGNVSELETLKAHRRDFLRERKIKAYQKYIPENLAKAELEKEAKLKRQTPRIVRTGARQLTTVSKSIQHFGKSIPIKKKYVNRNRGMAKGVFKRDVFTNQGGGML